MDERKLHKQRSTTTHECMTHIPFHGFASQRVVRNLDQEVWSSCQQKRDEEIALITSNLGETDQDIAPVFAIHKLISETSWHTSDLPRYPTLQKKKFCWKSGSRKEWLHRMVLLTFDCHYGLLST